MLLTLADHIASHLEDQQSIITHSLFPFLPKITQQEQKHNLLLQKYIKQREQLKEQVKDSTILKELNFTKKQEKNLLSGNVEPAQQTNKGTEAEQAQAMQEQVLAIQRN